MKGLKYYVLRFQEDAEAMCDLFRDKLKGEGSGKAKTVKVGHEEFIDVLEGVNNIVWRTTTGKRTKRTDDQMVVLSKAFQVRNCFEIIFIKTKGERNFEGESVRKRKGRKEGWQKPCKCWPQGFLDILVSINDNDNNYISPYIFSCFSVRSAPSTRSACSR